MIRVNIVREGEVIKTLHFADSALASAERWARDMIAQQRTWGKPRCFATLYLCEGINSPSVTLIKEVKE